MVKTRSATLTKALNKAAHGGHSLHDARRKAKRAAREQAELNSLAKRMEQSLDRIHEMAQEVVTDLRAARHSLNEESKIEHS